MPRTSQPAIPSHDTLDQRSAIMCAIGVESMRLAIDFDQENFAVLDTLDLSLLLLTVLQVDAGQALELEFGRHDAESGGEGCSGSWKCSDGLIDAGTE